jgi:protein-S-isoprenylcysteine O-methyltransferase Ste14
MNLSSLSKNIPALSEEIPFGTKAYDLMAALPLIIWYVLAVIGQSDQVRMQFGALDLARPQLGIVMAILSKLSALLLAVLLIVFLIARPPPRAGARGILPRVIALLGTYLGVGIALMPQRHASTWLFALSTLLAIGGMSFAVYSLLWLGRSFSLMPEARRLVTGGPYSVVRHPLYIGEGMPMIGFVILNFSPAALAVLLLQIFCQVCRMRFEEEVLTATFPEYAEYKARTSRILPGVY